MVEGAYKKLKSDLYYDKTMPFAKKRIAVLESDRELFTTTLAKIAENLTNQKDKYFDDLIKKIDFQILPKTFQSAKKNNHSDVLITSSDNNQCISKIIFFIDMPIELFILDYLWMILLGKIAAKTSHIFKYRVASKFKKGLYNDNKDLIKGIDFNSNRGIEYYYTLYKRWKKGYVKKIKENDSNILLVSLDLKSFYNSVEFKFSMIDDCLNNDSRLPSIAFLTKLTEKIYSKYTNIILEYKQILTTNTDTFIFPIGIRSANLLREIYLHNFDKTIVNKLEPLDYSRYVDDIVLLIKLKNNKKLDKKNIINKYFVETNILTYDKNKELYFNNYPNLYIQQEKIRCISFPRNKKNDILDICEKILIKISSEWNLLPDIDTLNSSFATDDYDIETLELNKQLGDLGFLNQNNSKAVLILSSLRKKLRNVTLDSENKEILLSRIAEFFSGSNCIKHANSWRLILEIFLLCGDVKNINKFCLKINKQIQKLSFSMLDNGEVREEHKEGLLARLKTNLEDNLKSTVALVASLDYNFATDQDTKSLAIQIRESNLLNHNMVSFPLLNYSSIPNLVLTEKNMSMLFENHSQLSTLDQFKLKWSPRYIHHIEIFIINFMFNFYTKKKELFSFKPIFKKYIKYNNLLDFENNLAVSANKKSKNGVTHNSFTITNESSKDPKVALVNTKINSEDVLANLHSPEEYLTYENKKKLLKILYTAKTENVRILVFPEFYFPIAWLMDIALFAIKHNITIITGLQYLTYNKQAFNYVCTAHPVQSSKNFRIGFLQFREKNFYAPKEKIELSKMKYSCTDKRKPIYHIIDNGKYKYSIILCYEFVDITSRASMKSEIDILFVPQLNPDTNYFSAIVESSSRDLYCFVVQANTSSYGDSRITAPYRSIDKNILQIKGGETDVVMIAQLELNNLKIKRKNYEDNLNKSIDACIECTKLKDYMTYATETKRAKCLDYNKKICSKCKFVIKNEKLKGTPPNTAPDHT